MASIPNHPSGRAVRVNISLAPAVLAKLDLIAAHKNRNRSEQLAVWIEAAAEPK
jgi:metal-responsive CopG/Arc/MetJ family transcriptional regulator